MKKIIRIGFVVALFITSVTAIAFAAESPILSDKYAADRLYALGLFNGVGTNADGSPIYALEKAPTRNEAIAMLVRLLGKEAEAKVDTWETPFTDLDDWAAPYIGYAYNNGLAAGTSATTFGGSALASDSQYITFILRALGYSSSEDFSWDKAYALSDELNITHGEYPSAKAFTRGNIARISFNALFSHMKGSKTALFTKLGLDATKLAGTYTAGLTIADVYKISKQFPEDEPNRANGFACENVMLQELMLSLNPDVVDAGNDKKFDQYWWYNVDLQDIIYTLLGNELEWTNEYSSEGKSLADWTCTRVSLNAACSEQDYEISVTLWDGLTIFIRGYIINR